MNIDIKRFDTTLPLPEYKTAGAAAFDLVARLEVTIPPQTVGYVPLNIALKLPEDHWALLTARSSLHKKGLMMANGVGVGDADYCGDQDEYQAALFNFTNEPVIVAKGDRIVQIIILPRTKIVFTEVEKLAAQNRGGFGSTGEK